MNPEEEFNLTGNKRHYTIANISGPNTYKAYLEALEQYQHQDDNPEPVEIRDQKEDCDVYLTIKNYQQGLSSRLASFNPGPKKLPTFYKFSGPLGKSLNVDPNGVNVAYSAGTGVMAFLDLVAIIVR